VALEKAGGYYFSTGGSEMIISGDIKVKQGEIASFDPNSVVTFKDGSTEQFDVVVFATGYTGFPDTVRATVGEKYANTFNPVWGLDEEGEIRGVCRESNIPNLYFLVGNLSACRMSSKVLALQIVQQRLGVFGERCEWQRLLPPGSRLTDASLRHLRQAESGRRHRRREEVPRDQRGQRPQLEGCGALMTSGSDGSFAVFNFITDVLCMDLDV
jgi:hypothetical protein